jgi:hypothetical protein
VKQQKSNIRGSIGETSDVSLCGFAPASKGSKKSRNIIGKVDSMQTPTRFSFWYLVFVLIKCGLAEL